jgi:ribosomal protein S18 acetylase RimI-like enzyme
MRAAALDTIGPVRIVGFDPRWRADFARLNLEWLRRWFVVEPFDEEVLGDPERHILADGGRVLFALLGDEGECAVGGDEPAPRAVGTVALRHAGDGIYELTKMAVEPDLRGAGIGRALLDAAIEVYRGLDGRELYLESSSVLEAALRMYESAGFVHHPAPRPGSHYARADIHMIWEGG